VQTLLHAIYRCCSSGKKKARSRFASAVKADDAADGNPLLTSGGAMCAVELLAVAARAPEAVNGMMTRAQQPQEEHPKHAEHDNTSATPPAECYCVEVLSQYVSELTFEHLSAVSRAKHRWAAERVAVRERQEAREKEQRRLDEERRERMLAGGGGDFEWSGAGMSRQEQLQMLLRERELERQRQAMEARGHVATVLAGKGGGEEMQKRQREYFELEQQQLGDARAEEEKAVERMRALQNALVALHGACHAATTIGNAGGARAADSAEATMQGLLAAIAPVEAWTSLHTTCICRTRAFNKLTKVHRNPNQQPNKPLQAHSHTYIHIYR
jgi:hypothetical protein